MDVIGILQNFEGNELLGYPTHQPDIVAELNINRSPDDLPEVSTTYLGTDLVQVTDVFNAQPSFPIILDCHTNGEFLGGGKVRHPDRYRNIQKFSFKSLSEAYYM